MPNVVMQVKIKEIKKTEGELQEWKKGSCPGTYVKRKMEDDGLWIR
jgi:hypothetical protein